MLEQQNEKAGHNSIDGEILRPHEAKFVKRGIQEYGLAMARYSLEDEKPSTSAGKTPEEMTQTLASVKLVDPNLKERTANIFKGQEITLDDASFLASVFKAKAEVKKESFLTPNEKKNIGKLADTVVDAVLDKIGSTKGKAIRLASVIGFLATACSAKVTPSSPETTPLSSPVSTEVFIPTEAASQLAEIQIAPLPTQESTPTLEPEVGNLKIEISDEELEGLERDLYCQGDGGSCVYETFTSLGPEISVDAISTGKIHTIDILHPETGEKVADAEVALFMTKSPRGAPRFLNVLLQLRPIEAPGTNVFILAHGFFNNFDNPLDPEPYSIEEYEEVFRAGKEFGFSFNIFEPLTNMPYEKIMSIIYSDPKYYEPLQKFIDSNGQAEFETPPLLVIHGF